MQKKLQQREDEAKWNWHKGRRQVSRTSPESRRKAWLTHFPIVNSSDSSPQCNMVLVPTISNYSTASASTTAALSLKAWEKIPHPCLRLHNWETAQLIQQWRKQFHSGMIPEHQSHLYINSLQILNGDIKGIWGNFSLATSSTMNDGLTLRWADILHNHNTLLCINIRFFDQIRSTCQSGYQAIIWWIYIIFSIILIVLTFEWFVGQDWREHDTSRTHEATKLKKSSILSFIPRFVYNSSTSVWALITRF